ncbi:MAG: hypothetical protein Q7U04_12075 [Bacteriovorax sp.]|nr:hypothetical protein [Bacteriovorax sp.]
MKTNFSLVILMLIATSCASHPDVRPGEDGVHRVAITTDDVDSANQSAIRQANNYCDEFHQSAYIVSENKKYTGNIDEGTYNAGKQVSKAAQIFGGGIMTTADNRNQQKTGRTVGLGGAAMDEALGKGYTVEMKFKCH